MSIRKTPNFIVRELQLSDCEEVRQIWTDVHFEAAIYDNEIHLELDPNGIFVAQDIDSGKLIGVCSGLNLSPELAFVGQYAVRSEYQGLGVGKAIWNYVIDHIGTDRNIALYSAPNMFRKYRDECSFKIVAEKRLIQFYGKANCNQLIASIDGISLHSINEDNIQNVIEYDKRVCNRVDRTALIKQISKTSESVNLVAINEKQEVLGYCVLFVTIFETVVIEPLYANDERIAELLIGKCCQLLPNTRDNALAYYCWDSNQKSIAIAKRMGLEKTEDEPILFTKTQIDGNLKQIFCVSSKSFFPF